MHAAIVLQARLSSKRYPKKVLHEFWGVPMLEAIFKRQSEDLCNEYIKNKGYNLKVSYIVATSHEKSDSLIEEISHRNNITCYRGSLPNVLERYQEAVSLFEANNKTKIDIICRVTADTLTPDYRFLGEHLIWYLTNKVSYGATSRDFPEGLKCEIFNRSMLTEAFLNASDDFDKEHVTPYIIRNYKNSFFPLEMSKHITYKSVTLDTIDDAQRIQNIISKNNIMLMCHWEKFLSLNDE